NGTPDLDAGHEAGGPVAAEPKVRFSAAGSAAKASGPSASCRKPAFDARRADQSTVRWDRSHRLYQPMHFPLDRKPCQFWFMEEHGAVGAGRVYAGVHSGAEPRAPT